MRLGKTFYARNRREWRRWLARNGKTAKEIWLVYYKKNSGKPDITVQMLDGPPWAPHPSELDSINFDDFVRAAIVGYARGDGS